MTHIHHLEDYALMASAKEFREFVDDVARGSYELSIKYDGAPAVVFGNEAGRLFIATKGYFNKTPKKFFSHKEIIDGTKDTALALKLIATFDALKECFIPYGNVYWGDLLFWNSDSVEFQPNIVQYYTGGVGADKAVGIAIHTQLAGTEPYHRITRHSTPVWSPRIDLEADLPDFGIDVLDITQACTDIRSVLGEDFFTRCANHNVRSMGEAYVDRNWAEIYIHERAVAKNVDPTKNRTDRKLLDVIPLPAWKMIGEMFQAAQMWKGHMYTECNLMAQREIIATINKRFHHEGFVLKTPSATVKIVERSIFSYTNFQPDAVRGWSKS